MPKRQILKNTLQAKTLFGLLNLAFFTTQPWHHQTADAIWLLLSLASLIYIIKLKATNSKPETPKPLKHLLWLFALMPAISILSYLFSPLDTLTPDLLEPDTRWLLIIPIILAMRSSHIGANWILVILSSYAISSFISALIETNYTSNLNVRANGDENAVSFGMFNATIAIMLFAYFISPYCKKITQNINLNLVIRGLIFTLFLFATLAAIFSGTRAALLLLPIAMMILYAIQYSPKQAIISTLILSSVSMCLFTLSPSSAVKNKLQSAYTNTENYFVISNRSSKLTSIGQRLEQWRESWCIFTKHPALGTGPRTFKLAHQAYGDKNHCNALQQLKQGSYQAHSLYFNTISTTGVVGILCLLTLFFLSLNLAKNALSNNSLQIKLGGLILISVIIAHSINGLTLDLLFRNHIMDKHLLIWALPLLLIFSDTPDTLTTQSKSIP